MYSYIYDSFLSDKKYYKKLVQLENRVTDLGINGQIHKLTILKSLSEIVQDEINNGIKTIVVVGDNNTVSQIINVVAKKDITIGIVPIGPNNSIATTMGITSDNALENLSKRVVQKLDLGKANDSYFLSSLKLVNTNAIITNNGYKITPRSGFYNIDIYNLIINNQKLKGVFSPTAFNPIDERLEAVIYSAGKTSILDRVLGKKKLDISTFLPFKKLSIKKPSTEDQLNNKEEEMETIKEDTEIKAIIDEQKIIKTPLTIEIIPHCLKIIVGKDRCFNK